MRAQPLIGDTWFGTERRLNIEDFKGRFLLLDFWTLCCVNCHHVLAELRPLEDKYSDVLTVIGVHSPKFEHEKNPEAVRAAIDRHDVPHLVLNDPNMSTWEAYGVKAWPTLVLIDPVGEIIATYSGEGHAHAIDALISSELETYRESAQLQTGEFKVQFEKLESGLFNQPGKLAVVPHHYRSQLEGAELLVSNSGGHNLIGLKTTDLETPVISIGSASRGRTDGDYQSAEFNEPYGAVFLPTELAQELGYQLLIADTANHLIRAVNLETRQLQTIAGTGKQWMQGDPVSGESLSVSISTPWDIALQGEQLLIAMAGEHRIWKLDLLAKEISVVAGTTNEGLQDGDYQSSWFAQPSALVHSEDDQTTWVVDAETSALRKLKNGQVSTVIGKGLFEFGQLDGAATEALLQHPLGLTQLPNKNLVIADSYNHSLRLYEPESAKVSTLARDLSEPSDVVFLDGELFVVEASANRVSRLPIGQSESVSGESYKTIRPASTLASGAVELEVVFTPPPGQKVDDRFGPATYLVISSSPQELLSEGAGSSYSLNRSLSLNPEISEGVLHVAAKGASCDVDSEHATCHIHQQDWGIPVVIDSRGDKKLTLGLSG